LDIVVNSSSHLTPVFAAADLSGEESPVDIFKRRHGLVIFARVRQCAAVIT
jgi:hypothetical protein